jgi:hypothetical protein
MERLERADGKLSDEQKGANLRRSTQAKARIGEGVVSARQNPRGPNERETRSGDSNQLFDGVRRLREDCEESEGQASSTNNLEEQPKHRPSEDCLQIQISFQRHCPALR